MKLEEGMIIRYEGLINKILEIDDDYIVFDMSWFDHWADEVSSMKYDRFVNDYKPVASNNIIDLIEVGDYINGEKVTSIEKNGWLGFRNHDLYLSDEQEIKSIVTKEQFETVSYKVEK